MLDTREATNIRQLGLPGIHTRRSTPKSATCCSIHVGQQVVYMGKIHGGPRFGSAGVVTEALRSKAVVDMGKSGVWNIPYNFLTFPEAA